MVIRNLITILGGLWEFDVYPPLIKVLTCFTFLCMWNVKTCYTMLCGLVKTCYTMLCGLMLESCGAVDKATSTMDIYSSILPT